MPTVIERDRLSLTMFTRFVEEGPERVAESRTHLLRLHILRSDPRVLYNPTHTISSIESKVFS